MCLKGKRDKQGHHVKVEGILHKPSCKSRSLESQVGCKAGKMEHVGFVLDL